MNAENILLENAVEQYLQDGTNENYQEVLAQLNQCMKDDVYVIINGIPILGTSSDVDPAGINGPDQLFYIIIFTSKQKSELGENQNPKLARLRDIAKSSFINQKCGGICFNFEMGKRTILIRKANLIHMWDEALKSEEK